MAKKTETYNEVDHEQDSIRMMERINRKNTETDAAEEDRIRKQMGEQEKVRLNTLGKSALRCLADMLLFIALYEALKAGLMASAIVYPLTYLCAIHFGWYWNKVVCLARKGRGNK